jgi:23S rRNA pseudouridine1911/1915/1917 synthase
LLQQYPRQALHACKLDFRHPLNDQALHFAAPIPADMQGLMDTLASDRDDLH